MPSREWLHLGVGVVSGVSNLESSGVRAPDRRLRHDKDSHECGAIHPEEGDELSSTGQAERYWLGRRAAEHHVPGRGSVHRHAGTIGERISI
ncbi:hypothetical protein MES5069_270230 [Mesorhizobium escarrei]|uniref:Uncharacterized protein n=1 Tax=Mesorhizobium escarrei TaxID=666018 RepID=A0ABN8JTQ2_9HYPH|nr:hypothetical protein MES5069_270230 [Mesorhizobium escarrei]